MDDVAHPVPHVHSSILHLNRVHLCIEVTHRPDWLVADNDMTPLVGFDPFGHRLQHSSRDNIGLAAHSFDDAFTDAEDDFHLVVDGVLDFTADVEVGVFADLAVLRVADDSPLDTEVGEHLGRDLTGVGACVELGEVLRTNIDSSSLELLCQFSGVDNRRRDDDITLLLVDRQVLYELTECLHSESSAGGLPVAHHEVAALSLPLDSERVVFVFELDPVTRLVVPDKLGLAVDHSESKVLELTIVVDFTILRIWLIDPIIVHHYFLICLAILQIFLQEMLLGDVVRHFELGIVRGVGLRLEVALGLLVGHLLVGIAFDLVLGLLFLRLAILLLKIFVQSVSKVCLSRLVCRHSDGPVADAEL